MYRACIAVVDAARARLFTYERSSEVPADVDALDADFSRAVVDELSVLLRTAHARRLILCASPRMLGEIRRASHKLARPGIEVYELARDLVKLSPSDLREYLDAQDVLPAPPARAQRAARGSR